MKKLSTRIASYLLLAALPMLAAENGKAPHPLKEKVFHWSLVATWLSASADVTTSLMANGRPGLVEGDPIIGKRFGARGVALEFGSRGILAAVEIFVVRRHPRAVPYFSAGNAGLSIASSAAAVNNARLLMRSAAWEK
jgi:hypothetical protein